MKPARYRYLMRLSRAENEGRAAFERCRLYKSPKENNPYGHRGFGAKLHSAWEAGFREAEHEWEFNNKLMKFNLRNLIDLDNPSGDRS